MDATSEPHSPGNIHAPTTRTKGLLEFASKGATNGVAVFAKDQAAEATFWANLSDVDEPEMGAGG